MDKKFTDQEIKSTFSRKQFDELLHHVAAGDFAAVEVLFRQLIHRIQALESKIK